MTPATIRRMPSRALLVLALAAPAVPGAAGQQPAAPQAAGQQPAAPQAAGQQPAAPQAAGQQTAAPQAASPANRLVTGKMIYVGPMPNGLDRWLQEDLRTWGRYRVTSNPEGVDLEIDAVVPERQTEYRERHGVPLPKKESRDKPREASIDVVDWVSGERLWSARLADKKIDHNAPAPPPGPTLEINARGMTADQLALKITNELRRYVEQLESSTTH